jgi:PleD family two-component response regulator
MDGLDLCRKVRARPKTEYTYFILLTAIHTGRENMRLAMAAGVDDFLSKPLDREVISMRLRVADRILDYTRADPYSERFTSDLHVLQKDTRRRQLLAAGGELHPRTHRQQLQPWNLPRTASRVKWEPRHRLPV